MYYYLGTEYFATGEGITVCLLITRAYPRHDRDYELKPNFDLSTGQYDPGKLKYEPNKIAHIEFRDQFGSYMSQGAEEFSKEDFLKKFESYIPARIVKLVNEADQDRMPGNFNWHSQMHVNYS